jgi:hypothetical protein
MKALQERFRGLSCQNLDTQKDLDTQKGGDTQQGRDTQKRTNSGFRLAVSKTGTWHGGRQRPSGENAIIATRSPLMTTHPAFRHFTSIAVTTYRLAASSRTRPDDGEDGCARLVQAMRQTPWNGCYAHGQFLLVRPLRPPTYSVQSLGCGLSIVEGVFAIRPAPRRFKAFTEPRGSRPWPPLKHRSNARTGARTPA